MFKNPVSDSAAPDGGASTARTWAGKLVRADEQSTRYLHLYAFPCAKCNGPVIVGSLGTRENDLSKETALNDVGAICLACGCRPETIIGPSIGYSFRPVQWEWTKPQPAVTADADGESLATELSQDADTQTRAMVRAQS